MFRPPPKFSDGNEETGRPSSAPPPPAGGEPTRARRLWRVTLQAFEAAHRDNIFQLSAALSFFALISIAPVLILAMGIAGLFIGELHAQRETFRQLAVLFPSGAVSMFENLLRQEISEDVSGIADAE